MTTFVIEMEVTPAEHSESAMEASGAYANVYLLAESQAEALTLARTEVAAAGWNVRTINRVSTATAASFEEGNEGLQFYEQCQLDGVVIVFHSWRDMH